jgi:hypothetical protein
MMGGLTFMVNDKMCVGIVKRTLWQEWAHIIMVKHLK